MAPFFIHIQSTCSWIYSIFSFKIMANLGAADIDSRLEEQLIDGILYAFQEQTNEVIIFMLFTYRISRIEAALKYKPQFR